MQPIFEHIVLHAQEQYDQDDIRIACYCFNDKQGRDWFVFSSNMPRMLVLVFGEIRRFLSRIDDTIADLYGQTMIALLKQVFPTNDLHIWNNHEFRVNADVASMIASEQSCVFAFQVVNTPTNWKKANETWGATYLQMHSEPGLRKLLLELHEVVLQVRELNAKEAQSPPVANIWHDQHPLIAFYKSMQSVKTARTIFNEVTHEVLVFPTTLDKIVIKLTPHTRESYLMHLPCGCVKESSGTTASEFALTLIEHLVHQ